MQFLFAKIGRQRDDFADAYRLADMRFRAGLDSYLPTLTAQLSLCSARQQLITLRQADLTNEVALYEALGGGWKRCTDLARLISRNRRHHGVRAIDSKALPRCG